MKKITVFSELQNEFSFLAGKFSATLSRFCTKNPKFIFSSMLILMASSLLLCFTMLRVRPQKSPMEKKAMLKIENGISELGSTATRLKKTLEIREALKVLLDKDSLDSKDSLLMIDMIATLEHTSDVKN